MESRTTREQAATDDLHTDSPGGLGIEQSGFVDITCCILAASPGGTGEA